MSNDIVRRMDSVVAYRLGEVEKKIKVGGTLFNPQYSQEIQFRYIELITHYGDTFFIYNDRMGFEKFKKDFVWEYGRNEVTHEFWVAGTKWNPGYGRSAVFHEEGDYCFADIDKWLVWLKGKRYKFNTRKTTLGEYEVKNTYSTFSKGQDMFLSEVQNAVVAYEDKQLEKEKYALHLICKAIEGVSGKLVDILKNEVHILQDNYAKALDIIEKELTKRNEKKKALEEQDFLDNASGKNWGQETVPVYPFGFGQSAQATVSGGQNTFWSNPFQQSFKTMNTSSPERHNAVQDSQSNDWGARGEEKVQYQLKWLGNNYVSIEKDCVKDGRPCILLRNEKLTNEKQEYDHILVSQGGVYLIETKYFKGRIRIKSNGNWVRIGLDNVEMGMESPIAQVDRHHMLASSILKDLVDEKDIHDVICIAHETAIIEGEENSPVPVIKVDMLSRYIKENDAKGSAKYDVNKIVDVINRYKVK